MENKSLIKLNDVTVKFKEHLVLDKVCMEFEWITDGNLGKYME